MKLKELKHNHSLTDLLKVLIFSILMITPLLSVATRCLYVICNKNAYQSYYGETINDKTIENTDYENLVANKTYNLIPNLITFNNDETTGQSATKFYFTNGKLNNTEIADTYTYFRIYAVANTSSLLIYSADNQSRLEYAFGNITSFEFTYDYQVNDDDKGFLYQLDFTYYVYNDYSYMDNVFEYSVNKLAESPILSWTQQTAIYTGVSTMTTQLGVSTPTIAMLIVYWFLLTVIYIIIDIIIKLFTWLTHMIGSKSV